MISRRDFIKLCMSTAVSMSLTERLLPLVGQAYGEKRAVKPPVIWLELGSCTGNSVSLENAVNPSLDQMLTDMIDLRYHWLFSAEQGDGAVRAMLETVEQESGNFWLVIEGAVMTADHGRYNEIFRRDGQMITGLAAVQEFAPKAKYVIAVGDCACFGGPSAAHPNPAGATGVWKVIQSKVINIPGCPAHPDWMSGTFAHLSLYGLPELDGYNRPVMFFGKTIHELCQRRQQYEDGIFAKFPGDQGCLYKVGCKGPVTHADCPLRQWNHYVNWPVKAGAPCIGCASPHFPDGMMPFYQHLPEIRTPAVAANVQKFGAALAALGIGAVATHWAAGIFAHRIHKHYVKGTKPIEPTAPENLTQVRQELDDLIRRQNALLAEAERLPGIQKARRKKKLQARVNDFLRAEDKSGDEG